MDVLIAVITGLLGLAGGFLGARMGRDTEYQKWLRQERNTAFGRFLVKMKEFQEQASDLILEIKNTDEDDQLNPKTRLTQLQVNFEVEEHIVRLYLSETDRETFSAAIKDMQDVQSDIVSDGRRAETQGKVQKAVRDLFEKVLHSNE